MLSKPLMDAWRKLGALSSDERAFLAQLGLTSDELQVSCAPGRSSFSVVHGSSDGFSWAAFSSDCHCNEAGMEATLAAAKHAAIEAQGLWLHRCQVARTESCPRHCCPPSRA